MRLTRFIAIILVGLACAGPALAEPIDPALAAVLESRSDEDRSRDEYRHPAETLSFFGVKPGMTVAEALPGGGWYTRILASYLGSKGALYGVNYAEKLWPLFGYLDKDTIKQRIALTAQFPKQVAGFTDNGIKAEGFTFDSVPIKLAGSIDRVLMIRALHNLNRFEPAAGTRSQALAAVRMMLKPDGLVGVVQHRLPESSATGIDGSRGYLRESDVISSFEAAGFVLVGSSEINANAKDRPGPEDVVWRLPPSFSGSEDDPGKRAAMAAIGESDRMTLLFRKAS